MRRSPAVHLSPPDRQAILRLLGGGVHPVRLVKRAQLLLHLDQGQSPPQAASAVGVSPKTARRISQRYREGNLDQALHERPRPGSDPLLSETEAQRIVAMVCGPAPKGQARWSVRRIATEAVKRKLVARVGRETIRILLRQHDLKPWREKNVVCAATRRRLRRAHGRRAGHL